MRLLGLLRRRLIRLSQQLNKFCVTPRHFLLVTKEFRPQTSPLTPLELIAAWTILNQLGAREKHLAFFNSGALSGASQPHKQCAVLSLSLQSCSSIITADPSLALSIQFIPLSNGVAPFDHFIAQNKPQDLKAPFQLPLPYANFTALIDPPAGQVRCSFSLSDVSR